MVISRVQQCIVEHMNATQVEQEITSLCQSLGVNAIGACKAILNMSFQQLENLVQNADPNKFVKSFYYVLFGTLIGSHTLQELQRIGVTEEGGIDIFFG